MKGVNNVITFAFYDFVMALFKQPYLGVRTLDLFLE